RSATANPSTRLETDANAHARADMTTPNARCEGGCVGDADEPAGPEAGFPLPHTRPFPQRAGTTTISLPSRMSISDHHTWRGSIREISNVEAAQHIPLIPAQAGIRKPLALTSICNSGSPHSRGRAEPCAADDAARLSAHETHLLEHRAAEQAVRIAQ